VIAKLQPVGKPDVEAFDRITGIHNVGTAEDVVEPLAKVFLHFFALHMITFARSQTST